MDGGSYEVSSDPPSITARFYKKIIGCHLLLNCTIFGLLVSGGEFQVGGSIGTLKSQCKAKSDGGDRCIHAATSANPSGHPQRAVDRRRGSPRPKIIPVRARRVRARCRSRRGGRFEFGDHLLPGTTQVSMGHTHPSQDDWRRGLQTQHTPRSWSSQSLGVVPAPGSGAIPLTQPRHSAQFPTTPVGLTPRNRGSTPTSSPLSSIRTPFLFGAPPGKIGNPGFHPN